MGNGARRLVVVGSTGSIGRQALDVVRAMPQRFEILGLAAGRNVAELKRQVAEFRPQYVCHSSPEDVSVPTAVFLPLDELAALPEADIVLVAASGKAGLNPTLAAVRAGKKVALANKESLVTAGEIITAEAEKSGAEILPVDSEHSAVWQCLNGEGRQAVRIMLTASGGPFLNHSREELETVSVAQTLDHPSWKMGRKVTVDSATLMNKGLEVIEAYWLFRVPYENIRVIVHPQSTVHSMVEFADGSVKAQMSCPDMRLPIQYALSYPQRWPNKQLPRLDWSAVGSLDFRQPDEDRFPCLRLGREAGRKGGTCPAVLCAADEVAVELFLAERIGFMGIPRLIEAVLGRHRVEEEPAIEQIESADAWAREETLRLADGGSSWR